jgi:hypothetical protein
MMAPMREAGRQREALTGARLKVENQMRRLLARFGMRVVRGRSGLAQVAQVDRLNGVHYGL